MKSNWIEMKAGARVEYQTGIAEFGIGDVMVYDPKSNSVKVIGIDDGSLLCESADLITPINDS